MGWLFLAWDCKRPDHCGCEPLRYQKPPRRHVGPLPQQAAKPSCVRHYKLHGPNPCKLRAPNPSLTLPHTPTHLTNRPPQVYLPLLLVVHVALTYSRMWDRLPASCGGGKYRFERWGRAAVSSAARAGRGFGVPAWVCAHGRAKGCARPGQNPRGQTVKPPRSDDAEDQHTERGRALLRKEAEAAAGGLPIGAVLHAPGTQDEFPGLGPKKSGFRPGGFCVAQL